MNAPKLVKWVIAHEPAHLFIRTAKAFADEIEKTTEGKLKIEILTVPEYAEKYNDQAANNGIWNPIFDALEDNRIQMSQTVVSAFGTVNKDFLALDLPFLFKDHDHVSSVMEGPIGRELCNSLSERSGVKGLAFTYSGGYRIIGSNTPITGLAALQGARVRVNTNPVNYITMKSLGVDAKTHAEVGYGYDAIEEGSLDASESTYLRFKGTHILKTHHSMFMTTIAVSKEFWNSLDLETQELFNQAAVKAAAIERQWSIEDCEQFELDCTKNGVQIHELSDSDRELFKDMTKSVYTDVAELFSPGLIDKLKLH
jgi:TRAP-type C4-dicarboxylate transport system substrate-binding protein